MESGYRFYGIGVVGAGFGIRGVVWIRELKRRVRRFLVFREFLRVLFFLFGVGGRRVGLRGFFFE